MLWKKEEAVAFVPAQEEATKRKAAPLQQEEQTPPFSEDSTATFLQAFTESTGQLTIDADHVSRDHVYPRFSPRG